MNFGMKLGNLLVVVLLCAAACGPVMKTDLHDAVRAGDAAKARQWLAARPEAVNDRDALGDTPLDVAAQTGNMEMAELLLTHGADVNAKANAGWTALHWAAYWQHPAMAELLLRHHADANARNSIGCTPLHWAAIRGNKELVERLVANQADVNAGDFRQRTPLHYAAYWDRKDVVEALIAHNADVNAHANADLHPDGNGITPLDVAERNGRFTVIKPLRDHGAIRVQIAVNGLDKPSTSPRPQR